MKIIIVILILILTQFSYSQENYKIEINGKVFEIELGKDYQLKVDNEELKINIKQKDTLSYVDEAFSFKFPKEYKVGKTTIDAGVEQIVLMTPEGSGFIIQKYTTINPTTLNELMINEVTKESVNYGFNLEREDYNRILSSGAEIKVDRAVLTYNDEVNIYEIASVGKKDSGLLIMTMEMDDLQNSLGKKLISLIWNSLEIK